MRPVTLVLTVVIAGGSASARATTIADIVGAAKTYSGQQVTVVGTVTDPVTAYLGETAYNLAAGDVRITVFGRGAAPAKGDQLQVSGKVGWKEGDEEFTWPPIILESARQLAP
jgi:hypothetical protein